MSEFICDICDRVCKSKGGLTTHKKTHTGETKPKSKPQKENIIKEDLPKLEIKIAINNTEALKSKIHSIHNMLRNTGVGYGMNALKIFNLIYGIKKIEENGLIDKLEFGDKCKFSYLVDLAKQQADQDIYDIIYTKILPKIKNSDIEHLLYFKLPEHISYRNMRDLVLEVNDITKIENECNVLLSGKIYEYFVGRDKSAISELGAYFTDRPIVEFIYRHIHKKELLKNRKINSMVDMFGGSGGFTTGYINYLITNNLVKPEEWEEEIKKIYHYDINVDVIKSAGLEMFCLTGQVPLNGNLNVQNAFTSEFDDKKFDLIMTNPPYGGDSQKDSEEKKDLKLLESYLKNVRNTIEDKEILNKIEIQLEKIKEKKKKLENNIVSVETSSKRIKEFTKKYNLKSNDKEGVSLILLMELLEKDGLCCGVLKEGVIFAKKYASIRKCLIENFNVIEVISIPNNVFENTTTKTSIVIFENTGPTKEIVFSELIMDKYEENIIEWLNNEAFISKKKGQLKSIRYKIIKNVIVKDILNNIDISFNPDKYNIIKLVPKEGYKIYKISELCDFMPKSKRYASYGKGIGKYNFYKSSYDVKKCDEADYTEEYIIVGTGGNANIKIDSNFSCSSDNFILKSKTGYNIFIYNILLCNIELLQRGFIGSVLKHLSKDYLLNLEIPFSEEKAKYWIKIFKESNKPQEELLEELKKDAFY